MSDLPPSEESATFPASVPDVGNATSSVLEDTQSTENTQSDSPNTSQSDVKQEPNTEDNEELDEVNTADLDVKKVSPELSKTAKKRGRPSKSNSSEDGGDGKKRIKTEPSSTGGPKIKKENPKEDSVSENRPKARGRKAGTGGGWTPEQDAYLRQLYQQTKAIKDVHEKFEAKFHTGKTRNSLQLRWGKLKTDALVLSPKEEEILRRAIHTVENDKSAAILNIYNKEGGDGVTKLTQKFVAIQLKKWGGGSKTTGKTQEAEEDAISESDA
ncbi:hypothetical protein TWF718_003424 [Orbilia javanica]|uniref:Myb-like domain-containing protein n=1 Tax=Orbilia javanica TaxID=47235 RepID=A0AAN8RBE5_9PEZI